jgi:hypothetical protein
MLKALGIITEQNLIRFIKTLVFLTVEHTMVKRLMEWKGMWKELR